MCLYATLILNGMFCHVFISATVSIELRTLQLCTNYWLKFKTIKSLRDNPYIIISKLDNGSGEVILKY